MTQPEILGNSPHIVRLRERIARVAPTDCKILILGENGTGKELVAEAIHRNSKRKDKNFVALNCAAVPESLLEAEIFGHEKGAFTGAVGRREGVFERAHGGTLFLDEIGDMALTMQAKLLRVLQSGTFERIGGHQTLTVDVRVIAATNKNLRKAVEDRLFREDLYHRIAVIPVQSPPLRARGQDIVLLAKAFLAASDRPLALAEDASADLLAHPWPGNVRELQNVVQRLVAMVPGDIVRRADVQQAVTLDLFEHDYSIESLASALEPPEVITPEVHIEPEVLATPPEAGDSVPSRDLEEQRRMRREAQRRYRAKKAGTTPPAEPPPTVAAPAVVEEPPAPAPPWIPAIGDRIEFDDEGRLVRGVITQIEGYLAGICTCASEPCADKDGCDEPASLCDIRRAS